MPLDATVIDNAILGSAADFEPTTKNVVPSGPIVIFRRDIDPDLADELAKCDFSAIPKLRLIGSQETINTSLEASLTAALGLSAEAAAWLRSDIDGLIKLFGDLTGACAFILRLEPVTNDACSRFHADNVRYRMLTTYHGPGTEWISPKDSHLVHDGQPSRSDIVRRLETGSIALMRCRKAETDAEPALLHRSPPIAETGNDRLFLAIDDLADHG